jgi:hypothetical protein
VQGEDVRMRGSGTKINFEDLGSIYAVAPFIYVDLLNFT